MEYKSNKNAILQAMKLCKHEFCVGIGTLAVAEVQPITPVGVGTANPGNLKKCIVSEVIPGDEGIYIGVTTGAPYGKWVDQGSSKQKAQHFLQDGANNASPKLTLVAERVYKQRMGK
ncbi:hypothetical protein KPL47_06875 [Clostridium estertheticum]|uniref:hypothetical protein n=1 Tax=Clostridium estertheticum TaxID=238834 RepID=UPI001C0E5987|nr:hypothetical protein [Clostridium estertheticum]MBU3176090.1 hypothetical protein [Clostridium estertheticum]